MIYLVLAILSSALISIGMRAGEGRASGPVSMLAVNYMTCAVLARLYVAPAGAAPAGELRQALCLGVISGVFYLAGFVLFQWNVGQNGVILPSTFMKLGVLVPTLLSVAVFGEKPGVTQAAGFLVALAAIVLIHFEGGSSRVKNRWGLLLLLLGGGMADAMSKVYEELGPAAQKDRFLFYTFLTALVLCLILAAVKKQRFGKWELLFGLLVGIPNYFSSRFLLLSLSSVPAVVAFPTFSVATIVAVSCAGRLFFRESLSPRRRAALVLILVSLVLLNL